MGKRSIVNIGLLLCGLPAMAIAQFIDTPNSQLMKTDLLVVTAHPDDETMMAATMARYADEGKVVALVCCTHGEGGGNGTGKESGRALGMVREAELRQCLRVLGVRHLYFLDQLDFAYTESVQATLTKWGHDESLRRLVRLVRLLRPDVICTMDPAPVGGQHGHHQAAGRLATEAFEAAADGKAFPELALDEGLTPWRARKLYWSSSGSTATVQIATDGIAHGILASSGGKSYRDIGWEAARNHRSQGFDKFLTSLAGNSARRPAARPNGFLLIKSRILVDPRSEKDLFDGIAAAQVGGPERRSDVLAGSLAETVTEAPLAAGLRPRENVVNYREWLRTNGISRMMTRLPARVTVVRSRADNRLDVEITNRSADAKSGRVSLLAPTGWTLEKDDLPYAVPAYGTVIVPFHCAVPAEAAVGSHDASVRLGSGVEACKLDVVPSLGLKRLATLMPVDADVGKWRKGPIAPIPIPYTNRVQGKVKDANECSGQFFLGYDDDGLQVLVEVVDDTVASNIAPDDIKAHWRSTSVEICLDPTPRSENTLSSFKLGIFPQDTTGIVRAARDADAHPGPLEQIKSKVRIASRSTSTGYVVEAHIPWTEMGRPHDRRPLSGDAFGFNVIIYHASKKDARVGENIGKARLAWSFWPGVPGRPEVWGMAFLE